MLAALLIIVIVVFIIGTLDVCTALRDKVRILREYRQTHISFNMDNASRKDFIRGLSGQDFHVLAGDSVHFTAKNGCVVDVYATDNWSDD